MNYLMIGSGGTGGCIGGYLANAGNEVTLIARGRHLEAILEKGLFIKGSRHGDLCVTHLNACTMEDYQGSPDVIFVCVKGYSMEAAIPLIQRVARPDTFIIPVLNGVGIGEKLASLLPEKNVLNGCIYIVSEISAPGEITQSGNIFRVIFGKRMGGGSDPKMDQLASELKAAGIDAAVSDFIEQDAFRKFMFVSPMAASGSYLDQPVGAFHTPGEARSLFSGLVLELGAVAEKLGYHYPVDMVEDGLAKLDAMGAHVTASMHRDVKKGGDSELDAQVFEAVRMARKLGVSVPLYEKIAAHFGFAG